MIMLYEAIGSLSVGSRDSLSPGNSALYAGEVISSQIDGIISTFVGSAGKISGCSGFDNADDWQS